ncbi:hypothetical protein NHX12_015543 [Muraenolepis orangiensis]|uniref:DUF4371 domain-containing protein n=1 Tax=Muraenolepis orangiensis TaxID=630683 RepID=A0A9Q0I3F3_9TELE|nr:hypothetical protein NHX12_015543 [Muraenolepis orangiensis]
MKKELLKKIIENKSKIPVLADESTSVGHKSTLIVFLKASVDGDMEPIAFPLDLVELDSMSAAHIKEQIMGCLLKNGFTVELLREILIGFCSDGASVMLGVKSGVGKLLQDDFPGIILWHCLNHRHCLNHINFLKSLALMADVLTELKNLSEILQNRKTTLPKAHDIMTTYVKRIESFNRYPGQHAVDASQAEEVMEFKGEELRVGRSPIIDSAQFIRAVADNMKERLFTTTANRAQASVAANRKEAYNSLINQMAVLNPDNWDHDNPRFGDNEVRALCDVLHVNQQEAHLGFTEYKASGGRNIPNQMKKLLMAVDTLSPSNADCEGVQHNEQHQN